MGRFKDSSEPTIEDNLSCQRCVQRPGVQSMRGLEPVTAYAN